MRVLTDTSVFISYLLRPHPDSFGSLLLNEIVSGNITLLITEDLLDEITQTVRRKPHLIDNIGERNLMQFISLLRTLAEMIAQTAHDIPNLTRDRNDDYLVFYAIIGEADYLVSVDKDLLVLKQVQDVKIVHTGTFREILRG